LQAVPWIPLAWNPAGLLLPQSTREWSTKWSAESANSPEKNNFVDPSAAEVQKKSGSETRHPKRQQDPNLSRGRATAKLWATAGDIIAPCLQSRLVVELDLQQLRSYKIQATNSCEIYRTICTYCYRLIDGWAIGTYR